MEFEEGKRLCVYVGWSRKYDYKDADTIKIVGEVHTIEGVAYVGGIRLDSDNILKIEEVENI